jgi:hypothetical protein
MDYREEIPVTSSGGVFKPDGDVRIPDGIHGVVSVGTREKKIKTDEQAWALLDRIQREKLIRITGPRYERDELYDRH